MTEENPDNPASGYPGDLPGEWYEAQPGYGMVLDPWKVADAVGKLRLALSDLRLAGDALAVGIRVHNQRMANASAMNAGLAGTRIEGPVVTHFHDALHNARMALDKPEAADSPGDQPLGSAIIDDPVGELLAITLFEQDRAARRYKELSTCGGRRAPVSPLGLEAESWIDCPEEDRQVYRDMARGKRPLP